MTGTELKRKLTGRNQLSDLNSYMPKRSKTDSTHLKKDCISPSTSEAKFGGLWRLPNPPTFRGGLGGRKILQAGSDHSLESKMAKANRPEHSNDRACHDSISDHQIYNKNNKRYIHERESIYDQRKVNSTPESFACSRPTSPKTCKRLSAYYSWGSQLPTSTFFN